MKQTKTNTMRNQINALLVNGNQMRFSELKHATEAILGHKINDNTFGSVLDRMHKKGEVTKVKRGVYVKAANATTPITIVTKVETPMVKAEEKIKVNNKDVTLSGRLTQCFNSVSTDIGNAVGNINFFDLTQDDFDMLMEAKQIYTMINDFQNKHK